MTRYNRQRGIEAGDIVIVRDKDKERVGYYESFAMHKARRNGTSGIVVDVNRTYSANVRFFDSNRTWYYSLKNLEVLIPREEKI